MSFEKLPNSIQLVNVLEDNKNKNLTGNKMFDVVLRNVKKIRYPTKTDIIEHKGELVRKYLEEKIVV